MRQAATRRQDGGGIERYGHRVRRIISGRAGGVRVRTSPGEVVGAGWVDAQQVMVVRWHRALRQRDVFDAAEFSDNVGVPRYRGAIAERHLALQIGEGERIDSIAAIIGAEQREQRRVLGDGHDLAIAQRPTLRRKAKAERADFAKKW